MTFKTFIKSMTAAERSRYAEKCGTTDKYLMAHLLTANRAPKNALRSKLVENSQGKLSAEAVILHFDILNALELKSLSIKKPTAEKKSEARIE